MATLLREPQAAPATERPARISEAEYIRMCDAGVFAPDHVELVHGVLERMAPSGTGHGQQFMSIGGKLWALYRQTGFAVFADTRLRLEQGFIRAPDVMVARQGSKPDAVAVADVLLAVEIADSTRRYDLRVKAADYARFGVPHYWVVDLIAGETHVMTAPGPDGYGQVERVPFDQPLAVPGTEDTIRVAD